MNPTSVLMFHIINVKWNKCTYASYRMFRLNLTTGSVCMYPISGFFIYYLSSEPSLTDQLSILWDYLHPRSGWHVEEYFTDLGTCSIQVKQSLPGQFINTCNNSIFNACSTEEESRFADVFYTLRVTISFRKEFGCWRVFKSCCMSYMSKI